MKIAASTTKYDQDAMSFLRHRSDRSRHWTERQNFFDGYVDLLEGRFDHRRQLTTSAYAYGQHRAVLAYDRLQSRMKNASVSDLVRVWSRHRMRVCRILEARSRVAKWEHFEELTETFGHHDSKRLRQLAGIF